MDRASWKHINVREKFNACQQLEVDILQRTDDTDFAEAKRLECTKVLSVGTIAEHFIFRAYQILRDSMRVTGKRHKIRTYNKYTNESRGETWRNIQPTES